MFSAFMFSNEHKFNKPKNTTGKDREREIMFRSTYKSGI